MIATAHLFNCYNVTPVIVTLMNGSMEAAKVSETISAHEDQVKR